MRTASAGYKDSLCEHQKQKQQGVKTCWVQAGDLWREVLTSLCCTATPRGDGWLCPPGGDTGTPLPGTLFCPISRPLSPGAQHRWPKCQPCPCSSGVGRAVGTPGATTAWPRPAPPTVAVWDLQPILGNLNSEAPASGLFPDVRLCGASPSPASVSPLLREGLGREEPGGLHQPLLLLPRVLCPPHRGLRLCLGLGASCL